MYYFAKHPSPLGELTLVGKNDALVGIWMEKRKEHTVADAEGLVEDAHAPVLVATKAWLDRYFAGEKPAIDELPLAPVGGEFRQGVWEILCEIPYGETITYGDIAKKMAEKMGKARMSSQAVGGAVGNNPISIVIPCHRVVGAKGNLTGFGGGLPRKIKLLEIEGHDMSKFFIPTKGTAL